MNEKPLYIPTKVPDNNDYISGFGAKELIITGIGLAIAVFAAILFYAITGNIVYAILLPAAGVVLLVVCIWRDIYNESLIDKLRYVYAYYHAEKCFQYQYYDYIEETIKRLEKEGKRNDGK